MGWETVRWTESTRKDMDPLRNTLVSLPEKVEAFRVSVHQRAGVIGLPHSGQFCSVFAFNVKFHLPCRIGHLREMVPAPAPSFFPPARNR